jgi:hypothetical protein
MTYPHSTITQDEYDALKVTLAARDKEIERLRAALKPFVEVDIPSSLYDVMESQDFQNAVTAYWCYAPLHAGFKLR